MNKPILLIQTLFSLGIGLVVNFFILRGVLARLHKPQDRQQQIRLAAVLSLLLGVPSVIRSRQLAQLAESEPAKV